MARDAEIELRNLRNQGHEVQMRITRNTHVSTLIHVHVVIDDFQGVMNIDEMAYPELFERQAYELVKRVLAKQVSGGNRIKCQCVAH